jgi:hypothetical protein
MDGITDLKDLLEKMSPFLHESPYVFISLSRETFNKLSFDPLCTFREQEGMTVITEESIAEENKFPYDAKWACITLTVNSSLSAVGFLAFITGKLTEAGISINPVSAFYHDHLFVPWERRNEVMEILLNISKCFDL